MLDVSRLNDHSRVFAQFLFREFPDWLRYARFDPYEEFEKEALLVEVPRPAGDGKNGLFITTSEWEVSVGFGENFHTRFGVSGQDQADQHQHCNRSERRLQRCIAAVVDEQQAGVLIQQQPAAIVEAGRDQMAMHSLNGRLRVAALEVEDVGQAIACNYPGRGEAARCT